MGKRQCGGVTATTGASWHEANTPLWCTWPWPVRGLAACRRWPERSPSYRTPDREGRCNHALRRCPTGHRPRRRPVWGHPRRREEAVTGHSRRDRGRHPTEARKGGAHPRRAAGATGAYWAPPLPMSRGPKHHEDLKNLRTTLDMGSHRHATRQARLEAGARDERTL